RLNLALELLAVSIDLGKVIVGELAPLLLDLACHLLPFALDAVPVHGRALSSHSLHCCERRPPGGVPRSAPVRETIPHATLPASPRKRQTNQAATEREHPAGILRHCRPRR